jgi:beta-glucosidase
MPVRIEDIPGWHSYPGEHGRHSYSEGIFVGYRYYDLKAIEPAFPFGHGLSYTTFDYEDLSLDGAEIGPGADCTVTVSVRNTGAAAGKEVVQLYVRPIRPGLKRPIRELKAFAKLQLQPGEAKTATFVLHPRDFQYYDVSRSDWVLDAEAFVIEAGSSSRDSRVSATLPCLSQAAGLPQLSANAPTAVVFSHPKAEAALVAFFTESLSITDAESAALLAKTKGSFLGFYDTLSWYVGDSLREQDIAKLFATLNDGTEEGRPV